MTLNSYTKKEVTAFVVENYKIPVEFVNGWYSNIESGFEGLKEPYNEIVVGETVIASAVCLNEILDESITELKNELKK